jgi:putative flavoprotein involved in K+ transport
MTERVETIVIGAGQAGLSVSYHLTRRGREHLVLERGEVADTWRTKRWDGFYLNTPNWAQQLPGHEYRGPEPDAFSPLAEVVSYLEDYARAIPAPVRRGVRVTAVRRDGETNRVETDDGELLATNVIVAAGAYQRPTPQRLSGAAPSDLLQLHTSEYRNPEQLAPGGVLIVGGGQSGCQIADELNESGRVTYLSVGRCGRFPRRYRGREVVRWLIDLGLTEDRVERLPSPAARLACNPPVSGNDGGHDCHPRWLARRGTVLVGRVTGFRDGNAVLSPTLEEDLAWGDEFAATLRRRMDEYAAENGLDVPDAEPEEEPDRVAPVAELDLQAAGIGTILWANGYRPDLAWIDLPVSDADGWPAQRRGVTDLPGLYFVGVHWLHKRKSSLFLGVGEDAEYVVDHLSAGSRAVGPSV